MKVILIPEPLLDAAFDLIMSRVDIWKQISANKPELLTEHFKLEIRRLQEDLKNG